MISQDVSNTTKYTVPHLENYIPVSRMVKKFILVNKEPYLYCKLFMQGLSNIMIHIMNRGQDAS